MLQTDDDGQKDNHFNIGKIQFSQSSLQQRSLGRDTMDNKKARSYRHQISHRGGTCKHKKNISEEEKRCACKIQDKDRRAKQCCLVFSESPPFARVQGLNLPWMK